MAKMGRPKSDNLISQWGEKLYWIPRPSNFREDIDQMQKTHSRTLQSVTEQEQIKADRKILELEKAHQEQIQKLKEDKQTEIDKYQAKYFELLEQQNKAKRTKESSTDKQNNK